MKPASPAFIIFTGMIITQLFFTLLVYRSNLHLHQQISSILEAGYLAVPNEHILPLLKQIGIAFNGGLFFTLTLGITFSAIVYLTAWAWDRGYRRSKAFLTILSGFVIFCMFMINRNGFNPIVSFWFVAVYFIVFKMTLYGLKDPDSRLSPKHILIHVLILAALGTSWAMLPTGMDFFKAVRDHFLLSNTFGRQITHFYYRYTPYPTEACKPLARKQIKTCCIEGIPTGDLLNRFKEALIRYDYLPISTENKAEMVIRVSETMASFTVADRLVRKAGVDDFLKSPGESLYRVSRKSDRHEFTRRLLSVSLQFGLPIFLYACLFSLFRSTLGRLFGGRAGFSIAAVACLLVALAVVATFRWFAPADIASTELQHMLKSDNPHVRVAALRSISNQGLDILAFGNKDRHINSSHIPERLWWTTALANSTHPDAREILLQLLDDPEPIVSCKAYHALSQKGYRSAVNTILQKIETSTHWYVQGYAYQSLRTLGWKQTVLN